MAEWRVNSQNPVRHLPDFDHERCAALHNLIIARGWQQSGRALADLDRRTWWEVYAQNAAGIPDELQFLDQDVIAFLKAAQAGHLAEQQDHTFHRYLIGLNVPKLLNENVMYGPDEDDSNKRRYITLYGENPYVFPNHALGLVFDQDTHRAIHVESQDCGAVVENGRQEWLPLEVILEGLLEMIDRGKVQAVSRDYEGGQEYAHPWTELSYTDMDLEDTIAAWDSLVAEVEQRMGLETQTAEETVTGLPIAAYDRLDSPKHAFARRFIRSARKPRFTFIAPGLRIATQQPFAGVSLEEDVHDLRPVLLFENDLPAHPDFDRSPHGHVLPIRNFHPDLERAVSGGLPAGLYLTETNSIGEHPFEDGVKLLLPFALGSDRLARLSDNSLIGEELFKAGRDPPNQPRSSELYQSGFNPYIRQHDVQLRHVLARWRDMVRDGKWEVGRDGVQGGIEKWKEADAEETWADYVLPQTW